MADSSDSLKYLRDWSAEATPERIKVRYMDEDGAHQVEIPRWLLTALIEAANRETKEST